MSKFKFTVRYSEAAIWMEKTVEADGFRIKDNTVTFYEQPYNIKTDIHAFVNVVSVIRKD